MLLAHKMFVDEKPLSLRLAVMELEHDTTPL
jgi:hypothetical protein